MRHLAQTMGRDAVSRETVREGNSRTGKITAAESGRAAAPLTAAKTRAEEAKARIARDIKMARRVRRAVLLGINLLIIMGAVLDRIAETQLPENGQDRVKALQWIHSRLLQKRGRRMKNDAEIRTGTNAPERI